MKVTMYLVLACTVAVMVSSQIPPILVSELGVPASTDVCSLPKQPGPCKAYFPRYYYSTEDKMCIQFIYGGCQGNENNFETIEECNDKCVK